MTETMQGLRDRFNKELREHNSYPSSAHPGDCYIFDVVLGIDPRAVCAYQAISKKSYKVYVLNNDGNRQLDAETNKLVVVTRKFTPQQRTALVEWWDLLSPDVRVY